jgi:hypothetical protein
MRYGLRTLLMGAAIGPPVLWALVVLYDTYRWLKHYHDPVEQRFIVSQDPLRWTGGAICVLICIAALFAVMSILQRRKTLLSRERKERRGSSLFRV